MTKEINVQRHVFVPQHSVLKDEDVAELLSKYNISKHQMPSISVKDPALQGLDIKPGDVVKILRTSATQGKALFYRVVRE